MLVKDITASILADERFKSDTLSAALGSIQKERERLVDRSDIVRSKALIGLRIAEEALERRSRREADDATAAADKRLKSSLMLNPTDSFLWLMLYSTEVSRFGVDAKIVSFLDQSYRSGPFEGWIALRRNRLALAGFQSLSESIRKQTVIEFASLVNSDFTEVAAVNFIGNGWTHREILLGGLTNTNAIAREAFAKRLARDGIRANVPGVEIDERLWR